MNTSEVKRLWTLKKKIKTSIIPLISSIFVSDPDSLSLCDAHLVAMNIPRVLYRSGVVNTTGELGPPLELLDDGSSATVHTKMMY